MISVEQITRELLRVDAEASECAGRCGVSYAGVVGAGGGLGVFGREAQGAAASLNIAANHLAAAQGALECLRGSLSGTISRLSQ